MKNKIFIHKLPMNTTTITTPNPNRNRSFGLVFGFGFTFVLLLSFGICCSSSASDDVKIKKHEIFIQCLLNHTHNDSTISKLFYTRANSSSYSSVLNFSIHNLRFSREETPKPQIIITPTNISHIQASIICAKTYDFQIRTRSGGHDYEGLSYVSQVPFIIIDLINLTSITIDTKNETAWVHSGATLGELYYRIAEKSLTLGFPGGLCPTVGLGGYLSGGGFGLLLRKYGFGADNVIDANIVDVNGRLLDKNSMGDDLFWAIRGGGGGNFGIVVSWKLKLSKLPPTVTICPFNRPLNQTTIKVIHQWQYIASKLDQNLFLSMSMNNGDSNNNMTATGTFLAYFLGKANDLLAIMNDKFPEFGLDKDADAACIETSWIQSLLIIAGYPNQPLEILLNRTLAHNLVNTKTKTDYVTQPIPEFAFQEILKRLQSSKNIEVGQILFFPYGGKMDEISESETPLPHRNGTLYKLAYVVSWEDLSSNARKNHLEWVRSVYDYMTRFFSKSTRASYVNYRDLDIGINNEDGYTSYAQASIWGKKYFGNNFDRLVRIKTKVDPTNFFTHEQSIPISLSM